MLDKASRDILYEECKGCDKEHTVLWMMLELMKLKATSRWSDTSFSAPLELLTKVLPKPYGLPSSTYQAKKIGVQGAMLVDTNKMIIVRRLRMTLTKRAKKGEGERGRMSLLITILKALKREIFSLL
jgi:hypothetical protein